MQKSSAFKTVKALALAAMLTAMSVVIGMFCKTVLNFGNGLFRVTFENLPIILSGIIFGPIAGGLVGAASDLVSYLLSPQIYPPNLIVTAGATAVGIVSGIIAKFIIRKRGYLQIILSGSIAHIIGSMIIKPIGLYQFYSVAVLWRIPLYLVIAPIEIALLCLLFSRNTFKKLINEVSPQPVKGVHKKMKMTYSEALEYIHGINWVFCKPGLERTQELCRLLGNPQNNLRFVHVAGTNGKGSFCSMLDSILREEGYKTGLYTSPYVRVFNERMRYMGENITDEELAEITEYVRSFAEKMPEKPTEFELITCIAFEFFKRKGCDIVILEAGMGGRLDSTNVISSPVASIITGIALDHTAYLGDTEEKIAAEKAGIIKQGVPVLFGGEHEGAYAVISRKSEEMNAPCYRTDRSAICIKRADIEGTVFDYKQWKDVKINLLGLYQPLNAANVLECVEMLNSQGITVSSESVYKGLEAARWQARFEIIRKEPLMIFDGSHNPEGVSAAVATVKKYFGEEKVRIITGVMADKDYMGMVRDISSVACEVYTVRPDNPRALDAESLAEKYRSCGIPSTPFESVEKAVHAVIHGKNDNIPTVCMGSLYMYCQVMEALEK